jgi:hypothetical protein
MLPTVNMYGLKDPQRSPGIYRIPLPLLYFPMRRRANLNHSVCI